MTYYFSLQIFLDSNGLDLILYQKTKNTVKIKLKVQINFLKNLLNKFSIEYSDFSEIADSKYYFYKYLIIPP